MSREEDLLKQQLNVILMNTYDNYQEYNSFNLKIIAKEYKSKHGVYFQNNRRIEINNLSRTPGANLLTAIHELTHHVEAMDIGETAHKKTFYDRYYQLLCTALKLGYIDEQDIQDDSKDSKDLMNIEKYFGLSFLNNYREEKIRNAVLVKNAYKFRKLLSRRDFTFLGGSQNWGRVFETEDQANKEIAILNSFEQSINTELVTPSHMFFNQNYYVAVDGAYDFRETLKNNGFIWGGYGFKKCWVKKVPSTEYRETMDFLKDLRLVGKKVVPSGLK
ncbi:hypothetical protein [Enterococcus hulanensis]|uniref:hypothetical protein n=1 Tax=Enterococcus hulanensis TaxID=2559929 RepID=UPI0010F4B6DF|nr:hypothetical protein [Enterococcus hulanensis]